MSRIQCLQAFNDNYIWMIGSRDSSAVAVVDPGEAFPVQNALEAEGLQLAAILLTHHHGDHVGGVQALLESNPAPVYGPAKEDIAGIDHPVCEGAQVAIDELQLAFNVLDVPGHTAGHVAYSLGKIAFVGDTLFAGGCGRIFEGTPEQMFGSLQKLAQLPEDTSVFCAHEYTVANLRFALEVEPGNQRLRHRLDAAQKARAEGLSTVPSFLADELSTNPFLRCKDPEVVATAEEHVGHSLSAGVEVFSVIRKWKDGWRN